jgi:hypothetical protein
MLRADIGIDGGSGSWDRLRADNRDRRLQRRDITGSRGLTKGWDLRNLARDFPVCRGSPWAR